MEPTDLFLRSVGEGTDIVDKEMYTFETKGGESITLRPEMTASVVRAYLENGLTRQPGAMKFWYMGPMFRYDRPQAGRYRQFHQLGVEAIGSPSPVLDAEVIQCAMALFEAVDAQGLSVRLNSIGCPACKPGYVADLGEFLKANLDRIPEGMRGRIDINPGVDPGGVYWERWMGGERGAAGGVLAAYITMLGGADEVARGWGPTCVRACPMRALEYGSDDRPARVADASFDDHGIGPSVTYLRRP